MPYLPSGSTLPPNSANSNAVVNFARIARLRAMVGDGRTRAQMCANPADFPNNLTRQITATEAGLGSLVAPVVLPLNPIPLPDPAETCCPMTDFVGTPWGQSRSCFQAADTPAAAVVAGASGGTDSSTLGSALSVSVLGVLLAFMGGYFLGDSNTSKRR